MLYSSGGAGRFMSRARPPARATAAAPAILRAHASPPKSGLVGLPGFHYHTFSEIRRGHAGDRRWRPLAELELSANHLASSPLLASLFDSSGAADGQADPPLQPRAFFCVGGDRGKGLRPRDLPARKTAGAVAGEELWPATRSKAAASRIFLTALDNGRQNCRWCIGEKSRI